MTEFEEWFKESDIDWNGQYNKKWMRKAWNAALDKAKQQYPNSNYDYSDYVERRLKHNINSLYE